MAVRSAKNIVSSKVPSMDDPMETDREQAGSPIPSGGVRTPSVFGIKEDR